MDIKQVYYVTLTKEYRGLLLNIFTKICVEYV